MHGDIVEIRTHYPPLLHQSHTDGVDTVARRRWAGSSQASDISNPRPRVI